MKKDDEVEAHHRVNVNLMGKRYAINFKATAEELKSNVVGKNVSIVIGSV
jgi:hypothetical protein